MNLNAFIALIDGGQNENTMIYINLDGDTIDSYTLEQARGLIANATINRTSSHLKVVSFVFGSDEIVVECEPQGGTQ